MNVEKQRISIVLPVLEYGEFPELYRVACALKPVARGRIAFFFPRKSYRRLAEDSREIVSSGFCWLDSGGRVHDQPASPVVASVPVDGEGEHLVESAAPLLPPRAVGRTAWERATAMLLMPLGLTKFVAKAAAQGFRMAVRDAANFFRDLIRFGRISRSLDKVLSDIRPDLLVVGQDPPGTELAFLLQAAGRRSIPRLIAPFAMFSIREVAEHAWSRRDFHADSRPLNHIVSRCFPHWVIRWKELDILRLPGSRAMALELLELSRGLPWSALTEPAEMIAADSEIAAASMLCAGVAPDRIKITGSPVQDQLAEYLIRREETRGRLVSELGIVGDRPLIVCGWPANIFPWLGGRAIHYPDYDSLAHLWAESLASIRERHGVDVVATVHPKTLPEEFARLRDFNIGFRIAGAAELIAASDVFTTLNGSSITAWAIACGKPVLLFDCFETRYTDFNDVPGCLNVATESQFHAGLDRLCSDRGYREGLARAQAAVSEKWGRLDGLAGARLRESVANLIEQNVK